MSEHIWNNDISKYVELESCNGCHACTNQKCTEGARMTGCNHMICRDCFCRMHFGILDEYFISSLVEPIEPAKPAYPFRDEYSNLLIYRSMGFDSDRYKSWFIEDNEDLYNSVDGIEYEPIKQWFLTNNRIKQYEEDLHNYRADVMLYDTKMFDYDTLIRYETLRVKNTCPACKIRKPMVSL